MEVAALDSVFQLVELVGASSIDQRVTGLIPSQGTYPVQLPTEAHTRRQPINVSLSHWSLSLSENNDNSVLG